MFLFEMVKERLSLIILAPSKEYIFKITIEIQLTSKEIWFAYLNGARHIIAAYRFIFESIRKLYNRQFFQMFNRPSVA